MAKIPEKYQPYLEKLLRTAKEAGCPQDQVERFLKVGYIPLPWQWKFHGGSREADLRCDYHTINPTEEITTTCGCGPVDLGCGGARGPGKSHGVFSQMGLDDCQRMKGLKALFLRKTGLSAQESFEDLIDKTLKGRVAYKYSPSKKVLTFKNTGSKMLMGGFATEQDIDKYIGIEYDVMGVEELNQVGEERKKKLQGSLRTSKPGWRPRFYSSFNPGNIGHVHVKETYVTPYRENRQTTTRFYPSTYRDNPFLNPEYIQYLESLTGVLGKAWRDGDFDIFAGQFFEEWNYQVHVVEPFIIPDSWLKFCAYDHGRANPACWKWYAVDWDGNVFVYRELYVNRSDKGHEHDPRWEIEQIALKVLEWTPVNERIQYGVADSAIFGKFELAESLAERMQAVFDKYGNGRIKLIPSKKAGSEGRGARVTRWAIMHQYLSYDEYTSPRLRYFKTCYNSIRTIPTLIHDEKNLEDLDTTGEDHAADCDGYMLTTFRDTKAPPDPSHPEAILLNLKRKEEEFNINEFYHGQT